MLERILGGINKSAGWLFKIRILVYHSMTHMGCLLLSITFVFHNMKVYIIFMNLLKTDFSVGITVVSRVVVRNNWEISTVLPSFMVASYKTRSSYTTRILTDTVIQRIPVSLVSHAHDSCVLTSMQFIMCLGLYSHHHCQGTDQF